MLALLLLLFQASFADDYYDARSFYSYRRESKRSNYNQTFFSSLEGYQVNASPVLEATHPWVARVIHSRSSDIPHVCTALCIREGIFITAARCVIGLKIRFTTVIYKQQRLQAKAFVIPSNGTKQSHDDIGFIVVQKIDMAWNVLDLFEAKRTDDEFQWFEDMEPSDYKVVGYATEKGIHRIKAVERAYNLTELTIVVGLDICSEILTFHNRINGFHVPCYHSCTVHEFKMEDQKCESYHGVEGGAILDLRKNRLLGVATWGPYFRKYELPVGFSVVNSENFFRDYECAKRIWGDETVNVSKGHYQQLCD